MPEASRRAGGGACPPGAAILKEKQRCATRNAGLVGPAGFEPTGGGGKVLCLTAWRRPIAKRKAVQGWAYTVFGGVPREIRTLGLQSHNLAR